MSGCHIVVSGAPGAGKTLLARPLAAELHLPLLSKDVIKEALFDELGIGDRLWSRRMGRASMAVIYRIAATTPTAVIEAVFHRDVSIHDLHALDKPLIEVHCQLDPQLAIARFEQRADHERHPGHLDSRQPRNKLEELVEEGCRPLGLGGPLLEVDTSDEVDVAAVAAWVRAQAEWDQGVA